MYVVIIIICVWSAVVYIIGGPGVKCYHNCYHGTPNVFQS